MCCIISRILLVYTIHAECNTEMFPTKSSLPYIFFVVGLEFKGFDIFIGSPIRLIHLCL